MAWSRRNFCLAGFAAPALFRVAVPTPEAGAHLRALGAAMFTNHAPARRLAALCVDALGLAPSAALVLEQEQRVTHEMRPRSRATVHALIAEDFRSGRVIDINGLRLSRLEGAVLIAGFGAA